MTNADDSSGVEDLVLNGAITGAGGIEIGGILVNDEYAHPKYLWEGGTIELNGATSEDVTFEQASGTLQLDRPNTFKGTIFGASKWSYFILENISYSSVTNYSYSGDAEGGTLHIQTTAGNYSLKFAGDYDRADFVLAAGPQQLSTSPPSLLVSVTVAPAPTITGAVADQEITDKQTATLFSAITVADLNVNATGNPLADYVSVMLSNSVQWLYNVQASNLQASQFSFV